MNDLINNDVQKYVQYNYYAIPAVQHNQTGMIDILSEEVGRKTNCSFDKMTEVITDYYNCSFADVKGKCRYKNIVNARHVIMYFGIEILSIRYPNYDKTRIVREVARRLNRDRTSLLHAKNKIAWLSKKDIYFKREFQELKYLL